MLRPLWFLIKLTLLVLAITWVAARPGHVEILWNGYLIETSFGFLAAVILMLIIVCAVIYRFWRNLVNMPAVMRRYKYIKARERGYDALTRGLEAVASGDAKGAEKQARRAADLVSDVPLTGLLNAQAALMAGDQGRAHIEFEQLLESKTGTFFGLRGLMNEALKENDYEYALVLLRTAENLHPKREWILRTLFDAETRAGEWISADQTLSKAIRLKIFDRENGQNLRQALLVARAQRGVDKGLDSQARHLAKTAYRLNPGFVPAALLYAKLLYKNGNHRRAIRVIENAWAIQPHPELGLLWAHLAPKPKGKTEEDRNRNHLEWYKRLYKQAPQHPESNKLMGHAAMDMRFYTDAREWLKAAGAYKLLAKLEKLDGRHDVKAREWLELAAEASADPEWVCDECGHIAEDWSPSCPHCNSFNTIDWRVPLLNIQRLPKAQKYQLMDTGFIEPPQIA